VISSKARLLVGLPGIVLALSFSGCASPYHSDQGALFGGLLGAGTGAVVGHALGSTAAGAAIGAGVGAIGGAAIGHGMDETEARNRALIEQRLGRQVAAGAVTVPDVVNMSRNGISEELIINHLRYHGLAAPVQTNDIIYLQQQGVSQRVIATMQATQVATVQVAQPVPVAVPVYESPPPGIIIEERWGPPCHHYRHW
jgi:hypothetical protein